jgi:hypothetical protein
LGWLLILACAIPFYFIYQSLFIEDVDWEKKFDIMFVHKGEDGDDLPEKWSWNIKGSYPIEVKCFIREIIKRERKNEQKRYCDSVDELYK